MKCIIVQLHTQRSSDFSLDEFLHVVRTAGRYPEVEPEEETPSIINLNFFTDDAVIFWQSFNQMLQAEPNCAQWLKSVAIIVCEGEQGWNDALLLAHFDETEALDTLK